jgi:protein-disulfide isomerase
MRSNRCCGSASAAELKPRSALILLAAAAALAMPLAFVPGPASAQAQRDWSRTIVATPEGGFRMGNPAAAVKLVEFVSLTCPHCREFAASGARQLVQNYVRSGRLSFEIRPFPLDAVASMAAQLNRCAPAASAFALNDAILAGQQTWFGRLTALSDQQIGEIERLPEAELRVRVAAITGLDAIAVRHGIPAARVRSCLADEAGASRIAAIKAAGERLGINGTPSFMINERVAQHVHDWAALEPLLRGR